jgi:2EXR family
MAAKIQVLELLGPSFLLFARLPPELRNQIWHDALPAKVGPHLFLYKPGSWGPYQLNEADPEYSAENNELNWEFRWDYNLIQDTYFSVPLFFVNHEARSVALGWLYKHRIDTRTIIGAENSPRRVFLRGWNPVRDAIYVPIKLWNEFLQEPAYRLNQADIEGRSFTMVGGIWHLAVPETLKITEHDILALFDELQYYPEIRALYIVLDPQPDLDSIDINRDDRITRWEFEDAKAGMYIYNDELGMFDFVPGERRCQESLYKHIEDITNLMSAELIDPVSSPRICEIRPVVAIRK